MLIRYCGNKHLNIIIVTRHSWLSLFVIKIICVIYEVNSLNLIMCIKGVLTYQLIIYIRSYKYIILIHF